MFVVHRVGKLTAHLPANGVPAGGHGHRRQRTRHNATADCQPRYVVYAGVVGQQVVGQHSTATSFANWGARYAGDAGWLDAAAP